MWGSDWPSNAGESPVRLGSLRDTPGSFPFVLPFPGVDFPVLLSVSVILAAVQDLPICLEVRLSNLVYPSVGTD